MSAELKWDFRPNLEFTLKSFYRESYTHNIYLDTGDDMYSDLSLNNHSLSIKQA